MPTKTGPDLSFAVVAIENLMDDECVITRDTTDVDDIEAGPLDPNTFEIGASAPTQVYPAPADPNPGRCQISITGPASTDRNQAGAELQADEQILKIPLTYVISNPSAEPRRGDQVTMTASRRDPAVVGKKFVIKRVMTRTLSTSRRMIVGVEAGAESDL